MSIRQGDSKRAVGLLRVSTSRQELSPHAQAEAIEQWAKANGVEVVAMFFDNGVSGNAPVEKRLAVQAALRSLRPLDVGAVVVAKRDRLARDPWVAATIERMVQQDGASVFSAAGEGNGSTPTDKFLRSVLDAVAELERNTIRVRTKMALAAKKARGESKPRKPRITPGIAPYGFTLGKGCLVPCSAEQAVLAAARAHHEAGLSMAQIAKALETQGYLNRNGKPFARERVWQLLQTTAATQAA